MCHTCTLRSSPFRKLGSTLPIEIMYLGEEDLGEELREMLEDLPGVVSRDMSRMIDDAGWQIRGWASKPWAILMSSFREALFLDADVLFFVNPDILFDDPQYEQTGALFFKDRNLPREQKRKWLKKVLPSPVSDQIKRNRLWTGESGHMQDSGVVVIDNWRHFVPLLLTARLNGPDRDGNKEQGKRGVYDMMYGDKETFWLGWEMAGEVDYAFHNGSTGIMGSLHKAEAPQSPILAEEALGVHGLHSDHLGLHTRIAESKHREPQNVTVCSPQLLHFDVEDRPLWLNGWLSHDKYTHPEDVDIDAFQVYLKEPRKDKRNKTEIWKVGENNNCCLTADSSLRIAPEEREVLGMIIALAKEVDWEVF
ncbi:hypothetical protein B0A55_06431 [Friedmanniomyces simplex]|uniref:Uncharacterized protein n=1 Tax=Friedmanniomyces simplex TaxID=329884 RepID=A0A4U0X938_9PEZI|nr:hypothetical protein B0A55_06431 [Friedmanniomyces simplex]